MSDEDVRQLLGKLEAHADESRRQWGELWKVFNNRIAPALEQVNANKRDIDDMKPHVDDWRKWKNRGIGLLAASGLGGAGIVEAFKRLTGHG